MRDRHRVVETCTAHLEAARRTLFASLG